MRIEKENVRKKIVNEIPFVALTLIYLFIFMNVQVFGDDAVLRSQYANLTWKDQWELVLYDYYNWSSRVIVNFVIHVVLGQDVKIWAFLSSIVIYIMSKAMSELFGLDGKIECNVVLAGLILMYPLVFWGEAGYETTSMTYMWPMAAGFLSMVPIRKEIDHIGFKPWEYIVYSVSLLYAANEEIIMVVVMFSYFTFVIWNVVRREKTPYLWVQLILAIGSFVFTMTAPGNSSRSVSESANWFKEYGMLSMVDKAEIGFASTIRNVLFEEKTYFEFFIVTSLLLTLLVWKCHRGVLARIVSIIPSVISIVFGVYQETALKLIPYTDKITRSVDGIGLIQTENFNHIGAPMAFALWCFVWGCFVICVILTFKDNYKFVMSMVLLIAGIASRTAMGFSPTVYASEHRTYIAFCFALISIGTLAYAEAADRNLFTKEERRIFAIVILVVGINRIMLQLPQVIS